MRGQYMEFYVGMQDTIAMWGIMGDEAATFVSSGPCSEVVSTNTDRERFLIDITKPRPMNYGGRYCQ